MRAVALKILRLRRKILLLFEEIMLKHFVAVHYLQNLLLDRRAASVLKSFLTRNRLVDS